MKNQLNSLLLLMALTGFAACAHTGKDAKDCEQAAEAVTHPKVILIVKGIKSNLSYEEMERRYTERMPQFRATPGLVQKYYAYDEKTQEYAGIYLWESQEALQVYLQSDLRSSIPTAYEIIVPPEVIRFDLTDVLRR